MGSEQAGVTTLLDLGSLGDVRFLYGVPPQLDDEDPRLLLVASIRNGIVESRVELRIGFKEAVALYNSLGLMIGAIRDEHVEKSLREAAEEHKAQAVDATVFFDVDPNKQRWNYG